MEGEADYSKVRDRERYRPEGYPRAGLLMNKSQMGEGGGGRKFQAGRSSICPLQWQLKKNTVNLRNWPFRPIRAMEGLQDTVGS